jgi:geranylgeranyl diphosphate synthase type II
MNQLSSYTSFIQDEIGKLHLPEKPQNLYDPLRYFLQLEGKKIRPVLTLLSSELFGGTMQSAKHAALSIEIFHNFTLIHDDIMDKAPLRRGQSTVHHKWNDSIAILSGDVLLIKAYQQLSMTPSDVLPSLIDLFNQTAVEVCEGQQLDMDFEKRADVSQDEYMNMIRLKTSVLLGCALKMGGLICKASIENCTHIYNFGVNLGMAFQIQDDWLDLYGDHAKVGKQTGGDIIANKNTLLSIVAKENANQNQLSKLQIMKDLDNPLEKVKTAKVLFEQLNVKENCLEVMKNYHSKAMESLSKVQTKHDKSTLIGLTSSLLNREF